MSVRLLRIVGSSLIACVALIAVLTLPNSTWGIARVTTLCVQPGNLACFSSISAALAAAQPDDTIRVAAGTYIEYVTITKTVTLQGGWNASFTVRDPAVNVTLIRPPDSTFSVVYIQGQFGNPSAVAPTLDGFTITGGGGGNHGGGLRVTDSNAVVSNNVITGNVGFLLGGGVWVQRGAPRFENNRIENNVSDGFGQFAQGGGIQLENTQAILIDNVIAGNVVSGTDTSGGGVDVSGGGPVTLIGNTVFGNAGTSSSGYGGGVSARFVTITLSSNLIQSNTANSVALGFGGGVYVFGSAAFTLTNNIVMSNTAGFAPGSGPYLLGGGVLVDSSHGLLFGNVIAGNRANRNTIFGNGGGLAVFTGTLNLQGDQIINNSASRNCEGYGGGVYASNSAIALDAVRVQNNCAANTPFYGLGGGLAFVNSPYTLTNALIIQNYSFGNDTAVGGLSAGVNSPGLLVNNTFANNRGQGIRTASPITLTNNIIMSHTTGVSLTAAVPVSVTYNDFYANTTPQRGFSLDFSNIVIDPQLDADYHLLPVSPLIDAGARTNAPDHDFDSQPRPMIGASGFFRFDIGADEFTGPAQTTRDLATQPADFTLIGPGNPTDNPNSNGSNDWIGYAVLGGDINGDARADLIAGAPNLSGDFDGGTNDDGRVFALYNTSARRLGAIDLYTDTASLEVRSWLHQQHIGQAFAASDLDGDGQPDLIIGATGASNFDVTGTLFVFAGGASLSGTRTLSPTMQATYRIQSDQNTSSFGGANALAAGQLNGAGPTDLAIGEANATVAGRTEAGAVYVFFGNTSLPALWDMRVLSPSLTIHGAAANDQLGKVVLGDVNGDGQLDLIARSMTTLYVFYGPLASGVIDLATTPANLVLNGLSDGRLAAGDVDGDGQADIVLGDGSQVKIVRGNPFTVLTTFSGVTASALHTLDWNHDGKAETVIGEHAKERAFVIFGSATLSGTVNIVERADWIINGETTGDQFGYSLGGGDLDADGTADLIIGSRSHVLSDRADPHFNDAGAVYVLYGPTPRRVYLPVVMK